MDDEVELTLWWRAYALLLGAIVQQDLNADVDLAFRVADMVAGEPPDQTH